MYIAKILKSTLFIIKNNRGENLMVKYKEILGLFCVYVALILVALYISLFFIPDMIVYITFITQAGAAFISIVVFSFYLRSWKILEIFTNISNLLNENSNWELMQKSFDRALRLKPLKNERTTKYLVFLVTSASLLIIISITINLIMSVGIAYYIIPVFFTIFLVIIGLISKVSENPAKKLINWINDSNKSLIDEYNRLRQFKIEGTSDYFNNISSNLSNLSTQLQNFENPISKNIRINSIFNYLSSLRTNFEIIFKIIQDVYEIRGKLMTLMALILELRKNQVLNFIQLDQIKKKEIEVERLKNIEQKEAKFKTLEKLIEESFSKRSKEITETVKNQFDNLGETWNEKISEFQQKISQVYDINYKKFGTLNEELKDHYQTLQSKATSLFFEKFYQGLIQSTHEKRSIEKYFEEFLFVADIFFSETIDKLDRAQLTPIMEKLCLIHESMN